MPKKPETIAKYKAVQDKFERLQKKKTVGQAVDEIMKEYKITFRTLIKYLNVSFN